MSILLRVLIIEDSEDDTALIVRELRRGGYNPAYEQVDTIASMTSALAKQTWDIVIADYTMPHFSVSAALALLKEKEIDLPFIIVSGSIGEDIAVAAMKAGAHDYIMKGNLARLIPAIERELREAAGRSTRRRAEQALRESEERLRAVMNNVVDGIITVDGRGIIESINPAAERIFGYASAGIIGHNFKVLMPERYYSEYNDYLSNYLRTGKARILGARREVIGRRKDGTTFPMDLAISEMRLGERRLFIATMHDITDRKQFEEALQESEKRYRTLFESARDAIFILDTEGEKAGQILAANQAAAEMHGYTVNELLALNITNLDTPDAVKEAPGRIQRILKGEWIKAEITHRKKDGTVFPVEISAGLLELGDRKYLLAFDRDMTERKRIEEELQQSLAKLQRAMEGTVQAMALMVEMRDPYTAGHQRRVSKLACAIARELGLAKEQIEGIRIAGLLHDIGKISVPAEILSKPGRISEGEFSIIKTHPQVGYEILKGIEFYWPISQIVLQHHERVNGSGYPAGLAGENILLEARILSVADVVEAMSSHRPYRPARGTEQALAEIIQNRRTLYDADLVDACLSVFTKKGFSLETTIK